MDDVPRSNTVDVVPYGGTAVDSSQSRDETGDDGWFGRGTMFFTDAFEVAE